VFKIKLKTRRFGDSIGPLLVLKGEWNTYGW